jgi:superfamily II DNA or RNA helicase
MPGGELVAKLEELTRGASVDGVVPGEAVTVVDVRWYGTTAIEVTYKLERTGAVANRLLYRGDEDSFRIVAAGRSWAFDGDGRLLRLVSEAFRIRLAYLFDPQLAVTISQVEALPHQISAVYEEMLRRQPLRYLLADDPGAGKTIMAGLFIKELLLRGDLERCLIVAPANLAEQWQDELFDKFRLRFDIVGRGEIEQAVGNPFDERNLVISRIDLMKQDANMERLGQVEWDLVVVDEAHKMSASFFSGEVKETERYKLGKLLSARTRHLLLLTATPHRGKEEDFQLFLALIDGDRFEGRFRDGVHQADVGDIMRRLLKEDLVDFDGRPLFPERRASTVNYPLSDAEARLYEAVTRYVTEEMSRADRLAEEVAEGKRRRTNVGFALTTLQRRLASSPEAIYQSIVRRRKRLENRLEEERLHKRVAEMAGEEIIVDTGRRALDEEDLEDLPEDEIEEIVDLASAARTVAELEIEIEYLKKLEALARDVRHRETDSKWVELSNLLLERAEMFDPNGQRRKLVIFTEHRDTLNYLVEKIRKLLGKPEAIVEIHGGMGRELRRNQQNLFVNDPDVLVLVGTDAAGEGINLQRAHLMVNYDLPWNPNRLEQRFGRIHRFGQHEVCHCWNLVAHETREGAVFQKLLEKLETERQALGGKVFDVLGGVFNEVALRDLLLEAIRYGDDPAVQHRLEERVGEIMSHEHYQQVIDLYALAAGTLDDSRIRRLKEWQERAEINKLVPHFIAAFFIEAFRHLGGTVHEREPRRYEIRHVPAEIRRRDRQIGYGPAVLQRYERICFEKERINITGKPQAEFVTPGHPLLDSVIDLVLERYRDLLHRGAILIDPDEAAERTRALFYVQHDITDGRLTKAGDRRVVSSQLHFVEIDDKGEAHAVGAAPYLNYRAPTEDELPTLERVLSNAWLQGDLDEQARAFAIEQLVPQHFDDVRKGREAQILKTMAAVKERLTKEIAYWDHRAEELKLQELAGKKPRLNSGKARERCDELTLRLQERMKQLELEKQLAPQPPVVAGGALVVPETVLATLMERRPERDPQAVRRIEALAMAAVMEAERQAGRLPTDVSAQNLGYDIESREPEAHRLRLIEVKGRHVDAETITITRNELLVALNKRADYYLAVARVGSGDAVESLHYVRDPLARALSGDTQFGLVSVVLKLDDLLGLETAELVK